MSSSMTYKGYAARIEYDDDDRIFTGRIAGIRDGVGFHADSVDSLRRAFHEAVEDYLETLRKDRQGTAESLFWASDVPSQPGHSPQGCRGSRAVRQESESVGRRGAGSRCR